MKDTAIMLYFIPSICFIGIVSAGINHSRYKAVEECLSCHTITLPTHPMEKPKEMTEAWPLDAEGEMTCITCHDCIKNTCPLREKPLKICRVCHDCTQGMSCLIGAAHMGSSPDIEMLVRDCIACHNGSLGRQAGGPGDHKIDVFYIEGKGFKPVTDRRIIFINNKVTCISCHNPYASEGVRLVFSNKGSRLCLTCHRK